MTGHQKILICSAIILFAVFTFSSAGAENLQRTIMKVDKLTCGGCLTNINSKLGQLEGFVGMRADLGKGIVAVDHRSPLESKKVAYEISSIGYPAKIISKPEADKKKTLTGNDGKPRSGCGSKSGGCCGSGSSAWKELLNRMSGKNSDQKKAAQ